ncbi:MAG: ribonuclease T, partial [Gammaproteobacteria bacterium]|nr:ribonuclease T [Gammaproteobacteria bacterium]
TDALLEIAAVLVAPDSDHRWRIEQVLSKHIQPFAGANMDPAALEFNGIDPDHPFRKQIAESEAQALGEIFKVIRKKIKQYHCRRAVLVGHNAAFDLAFLNAASARCNIKRNPFHPFSTFDTVSLAGLAYGQTVLSRAVQAAGINWDSKEAHSARYDAEKTAELFCKIVNECRIRNSD